MWCNNRPTVPFITDVPRVDLAGNYHVDKATKTTRMTRPLTLAKSSGVPERYASTAQVPQGSCLLAPAALSADGRARGRSRSGGVQIYPLCNLLRRRCL